MDTLALLQPWLRTCPALEGEALLLDFLGRASGWSLSAVQETPHRDILGIPGGSITVKLSRRCIPADDRERAAARTALASAAAWAEENAPGTVIGGHLRLLAASCRGPVQLASRGSAGSEDYERLLTIMYERTGE